MINLSVRRMKLATNKVFNKKLEQWHDELVNNAEYYLLKRKTTLTETADRVIFNGTYLSTLALISEDFTADYMHNFININSTYVDNTLASEKLYLNVMKLDKDSTLMDKLYAINLINIFNSNKDVEIKVSIYDHFIDIHSAIDNNPALDIYNVACGDCIVKEYKFIGLALADTKEIVLLSMSDNNDGVKVSALSDVVIIVDGFNLNCYIFSLGLWNNYKDNGPLITINSEWR